MIFNSRILFMNVSLQRQFAIVILEAFDGMYYLPDRYATDDVSSPVRRALRKTTSNFKYG